MKIQDIEIPYVRDRGKRYRFFEMLPGLISWSILLLPFVLSLINPTLTVFFILTYLLIWFAKAIGYSIRVLQGWRTMQYQQKLDWPTMLTEIESGQLPDPQAKRPKWHYTILDRLAKGPLKIKPSEVIHVALVATYNESRDTLEPTIQSILASQYDMKKVILVLAFEERGGTAVEAQAYDLINQYKGQFLYAMAVKHPKDIPDEIIGKGGNITFAARVLQKYLRQTSIDPNKVLVTTLDADNRPHSLYMAALTYTYVVSPDPLHTSYQPIPLFTNNIWDAPAPMRVIATGNSTWMVISASRPHILRNFSAHAQSMQALIDTDFWSVRTVVEDGHQYWRTYFRYDGKHEVYPIFLPIYQDAVLASTLRRTFKAQFIQLRRWAWGCSDIAYVLETGYFKKNNVNKWEMTSKFLRLLEGHISWATAPLISLFMAFIPVFFNPNNIAANQLPYIASRIQQVAMFGALITLYLGLKVLPPKPLRYKRRRTFFMVIQWAYLPFTTIFYAALSGLNSQTRLMFGRYLGKFDVTEKAVKHD
jgi:hypothetical protein